MYQYGDPKYKNVRDSGVPLKEIGYPHDINYGGIYSPDVTFFRNNISKFYTLRDKSFKCDVITVAALCFNGKSHYAGIDELSYQAEDGGFTPEGQQIMLNKIRTIFRMGVEHGKDSLILGAFGCGAYALPSSAVAPLFRVVMEEPEFKNKFKLLVFYNWQENSCIITALEKGFLEGEYKCNFPKLIITTLSKKKLLVDFDSDTIEDYIVTFNEDKFQEN